MPEAAAGEAFEELTRAFRGSLASLRAAAETLELYPRMEESQERRLRAVVASEARRLGQLVDQLEALGEPATAAGKSAPRCSAEDLAGAFAERAAARLGLALGRDESSQPAAGVLAIEGPAVAEAVAGLLGDLRRDLEVEEVRLRCRTVENHAVFDLLWSSDAESLEHLRQWQSEALDRTPAGGPGLRPLLRRHGGEAWFNVDRDASRAYLRILVPLAG